MEDENLEICNAMTPRESVMCHRHLQAWASILELGLDSDVISASLFLRDL
jgi:hypothetical protein